MAQGFFDFMLPKVDWTPVDMAKLPSLKGAKRIGIDIETRDEDIKRLGPGCRRDRSKNYVVGIGIAIEDGPDFYLPFAHEGGDNLPKEQVLSYVRDQLRDYDGVITGANLPYEGDWLAEYGIDILSKDLRDVQVSDVLIDELLDDYDLEALCRRWEIPGKDEAVLKQAASAYRAHPKRELYKLPARYVDAYCRGDARKPLQILRRQEVEMDKQELGRIWNLERRVTGVLVKMKRRGIRIDMDRLEAIEHECVTIETEMCAKVKHATGVQIDIKDLMNAEVLSRALRVAGYEPGTTMRGKASVDKDFLKDCGHIGEWLARARARHHLRTNYCQQMRDHAIWHGDEWRVHTTINQMRATDDEGDGRGVRYGRTSCTNPSLQNQPIRSDEFGAQWRSIFVKDRGSAGWACCDWSQQEPRIGVHYAELLDLKGAKEFGDEYRKNPALDVHQKLTDICDDPELPRKIVKNFVNGTLYGMGDVKLCYQCHWSTMIVTRRGEQREVPTPESQAKINKFFEFVPWMRGLTRAAARQAEAVGFVWTWDRRKCRFVRGPDGKIWKAHKAFNRVGQGTAAGMMKLALVQAEEAGIPVQLTVHDETDFSYESIEQPLQMKEIMLHVMELSVPMKVDLEVGESWGEVEKLAA